MSNYYETDRAVSEYLLFHYGTKDQILPYAFGPADALDYPVRCVTECLDRLRLPSEASALDLGCAVGRASFELARHCVRVVGIDHSQSFVNVARHLQNQGSITYGYIDEGRLTVPATAVVPEGIDRARVSFEQGDAQELRQDLGTFDVILLANLIDRLEDPGRFLARVKHLVAPGGQLILTSPYTWLEAFTPADHWLGGFERQGKKVRTLDSLRGILEDGFEWGGTKDLPFLIREHSRKFQWSVAQASLWLRKT
jgi:putative 4-mercaptohistidine N1-methyltranferase